MWNRNNTALGVNSSGDRVQVTCDDVSDFNARFVTCETGMLQLLA